MRNGFPEFGDIFRDVSTDLTRNLFDACMVIQISEGEITLGNGRKAFWKDFQDTDKWEFIRNVAD